MKNKDLEEKLVVGANVRIGAYYAKKWGYFKAGEIIKLVKGYFEHDNGLYEETQTAPSVYDKKQKDWDSIYHLFGNDLEDFMDCEVLLTVEAKDEGCDTRDDAQ